MNSYAILLDNHITTLFTKHIYDEKKNIYIPKSTKTSCTDISSTLMLLLIFSTLVREDETI